MKRSVSVLIILANLSFTLILCSGCSQKIEKQSQAGPPAGSPAANYLQKANGGNAGRRPPGG